MENRLKWGFHQDDPTLSLIESEGTHLVRTGPCLLRYLWFVDPCEGVEVWDNVAASGTSVLSLGKTRPGWFRHPPCRIVIRSSPGKWKHENTA